MNLAFINQPLGALKLPLGGDSLGVWLWEVTKRLSMEHQVSVYARHGHGQPLTDVMNGVRFRRVPVELDTRLSRLIDKVRVLQGPNRAAYGSTLYFSPYISRIGMAVRRERSDVAFMFNFPQFAPFIKRLSPRTATVLNMQCEWLTQLDRAWVARQLNSVDLILGNSDHITNLVRERFPEHASRCHTLYNGVDIERFRITAPATESDRQQIVFVGRISPEKGVHVLIEAFAKVAGRHPSADLQLVGPEWIAPANFIVEVSDDPLVRGLSRYYETPYPEFLRNLAHQLGIASRVHFVGAVPHEELQSVYRGATILVNPSFSESFGMTVVEAMAAGVPVVAGCVGGMKETVRDGETGLLVPAGDSHALADAMSTLLPDAARRASMGALGRQLARSVFSWESVADRLIHLYARLLPPPSHPPAPALSRSSAQKSN